MFPKIKNYISNKFANIKTKVSNHFNLIICILIVLIISLSTFLAFKLNYKADKKKETKTKIEVIQIIEKFKIEEHKPVRFIILIKCEHEVFFVNNESMYNRVHAGDVMYMKYTENTTTTYANGKEIQKELNSVNYEFSNTRFDKDEGIFNPFDIFKKNENKEPSPVI